MALKMQGGAAGAPAAALDPNAGAKKKNMLPAIIVIVLILALAGAGAFFMLHKHGKKAKAAPEVVKVGEILSLDEFMLNLADSSNDHYLKVTISLGLKEGVSADKFKDKVPQIRDAIVMILCAKRLDDVRASPGKIELKKEIKDAVNQALGEDDVAAVYFEDFATQ